MAAGLLGFALVLVLVALRVPVAVAMAAVGVGGGIWLAGWDTAAYILGNLTFEAVFPYGLSVVPLFVFMGVFAAHSGLSRSLYDGVFALVGRLPGGLAMATVGACALFGAICGSSLATVATLGKVALPEMARRGYDARLAAGVVAAGGTLGVLIPPSIILVIYALITEQSIGALFAAALLPGLLGTLLYMGTVALQCRLRPALGPCGDAMPLGRRVRAVLGTWDVAALFVTVIGGIYAGLFSPTEAAAVGAGGTLLATALRRRLSRQVLVEGIAETAVTIGMIFMILIGAAAFNFFVEMSRLPQALLGLTRDAHLSPFGLMAVLVVFYVVLGCFMDSLSMVLLTVPTVFPLISGMGIDPVWFGVILVTVVEIGLITPPIGMNLFVLQGLGAGIGMGTAIRGVAPFIAADILRVCLLLLFPVISLWLPQALGF